MDFAVKFAQVEKKLAKFALETSFQTFVTLCNGCHGSGEEDHNLQKRVNVVLVVVV